MARISFRVPAMVLSFVVLAAPAAALAQSAVLAQSSTRAREANVWDWRDHQPTQAEVSRKEREAGIAPAPSQKDSNSDAVDELYQQLMHRPAR
jgi:hypothetical protein